jgi:hypothetical protein
MILKRNKALKWHSREVLEGSGRISGLRQEIPYFTTTPFCIEGAGVNKYLILIVREPLREDQGYLFPSDDQAELKIPVATVSGRYELVQHRRIVIALETALKQIGLDPDHLTANLTITDYGECMRVSFTLPNYQFDPGDGGEAILLRVNALNSVDKNTSLEINLTWCSLDSMTGMLVHRNARWKKMHLKSRIPLESLIKEFLQQQLSRASRDIRQFQQWQRRKVSREELSKAKPSPGQIEHWIDKTVAKSWGVHAAAKVYHIAKTGYDGEVKPFAQKVEPHKYKVEFTNKVPGSFAPVRNAYDISQVLSWLASRRGTIEDQLDRMMDIPYLMRALLKEEKPITLSM